MTNETDVGAYIAGIVEERDDALGTLRLRESDVRLLTRRVRERDERIARLETLLHRAVDIAERERYPGAVSKFITVELKTLLEAPA